MVGSSVDRRPSSGAVRRALAGLLCLALLFAGGLHTPHVADDHALAHAVEIADADRACDDCASTQAHAIASGCSLVGSCTMSATLAGIVTPSPTPAASVGPGDAQLHRGIEILPRPRPPKLSAA